MSNPLRRVMLAMIVFAASAQVAYAQQSLMQELNTLCQTRGPNTVFGPPQMFGEALRPDSRQDHAIRERYGAACFELARQDGLDFGPDLTGYTCSTAYTPHALAPGKSHDFNTAHHVAFGGTLYALRDRDVMHVRRGMAGVRATLVVLADSEGNTARTLYTNTELNRDLIGVRSLAGALDAAALRNAIPPTSRPPACNATHLDMNGAGWTLTEAKIDDPCTGVIERTIKISRNGKVDLVSDRRTQPPIMACD